MNQIWSSEVDEILGTGISLDVIGVKNWGLNKTAAFSALDALERIGVPILGGDVYHVIEGTVKVTYDNWYADRLERESKEDFVRRSVKEARAYINKYPEDVSNILFAMVPDVSE